MQHTGHSETQIEVDSNAVKCYYCDGTKRVGSIQIERTKPPGYIGFIEVTGVSYDVCDPCFEKPMVRTKLRALLETVIQG